MKRIVRPENTVLKDMQEKLTEARKRTISNFAKQASKENLMQRRQAQVEDLQKIKRQNDLMSSMGLGSSINYAPSSGADVRARQMSSLHALNQTLKISERRRAAALEAASKPHYYGGGGPYQPMAQYKGTEHNDWYLAAIGVNPSPAPAPAQTQTAEQSSPQPLQTLSNSNAVKAHEEQVKKALLGIMSSTGYKTSINKNAYAQKQLAGMGLNGYLPSSVLGASADGRTGKSGTVQQVYDAIVKNSGAEAGRQYLLQVKAGIKNPFFYGTDGSRTKTYELTVGRPSYAAAVKENLWRQNNQKNALMRMADGDFSFAYKREKAKLEELTAKKAELWRRRSEEGASKWTDRDEEQLKVQRRAVKELDAISTQRNATRFAGEVTQARSQSKEERAQELPEVVKELKQLQAAHALGTHQMVQARGQAALIKNPWTQEQQDRMDYLEHRQAVLTQAQDLDTADERAAENRRIINDVKAAPDYKTKVDAAKTINFTTNRNTTDPDAVVVDANTRQMIELIRGDDALSWDRIGDDPELSAMKNEYDALREKQLTAQNVDSDPERYEGLRYDALTAAEKERMDYLADELQKATTLSEDDRISRRDVMVADTGRKQGGRDAYAVVQLMTDEEKDAFMYAASNGQEAVDAFMQSIETYINERNQKQLQAGAQEMATEQPVLASMLSVVSSITQGTGFIYGAIQKMAGKEIDQYAPEFFGSVFTTAIRGSVAENIRASVDNETWGNILAFAYETAMSVADSLMMVYAGGMIGDMLGKTAKATKAIQEITSLGVMGLGSASQTMQSVLQSGGTTDQAVKLGLLAGTFEVVFEKVSLDKLLSAKSSSRWIKRVLAQAGTEASEEFATEVANIFANAMTMANRSDMNNAVRAYLAQGMTQAESEAMAMRDTLCQIGMATAGGFLSGIGTAGIYGARQDIQTRKVGAALGADAILEQAKAYESDPRVKELVEQLNYGIKRGLGVDMTAGRLNVATAEAAIDMDTSAATLKELVKAGTLTKAQAASYEQALDDYLAAWEQGAEVSESTQKVLDEIPVDIVQQLMPGAQTAAEEGATLKDTATALGETIDQTGNRIAAARGIEDYKKIVSHNKLGSGLSEESTAPGKRLVKDMQRQRGMIDLPEDQALRAEYEAEGYRAIPGTKLMSRNDAAETANTNIASADETVPSEITSITDDLKDAITGFLPTGTQLGAEYDRVIEEVGQAYLRGDYESMRDLSNQINSALIADNQMVGEGEANTYRDYAIAHPTNVTKLGMEINKTAEILEELTLARNEQAQQAKKKAERETFVKSRVALYAAAERLKGMDADQKGSFAFGLKKVSSWGTLDPSRAMDRFAATPDGRDLLRVLIEDAFNEAGGFYANRWKQDSEEINAKFTELGIKQKSKEDAAVMWIGEGERQDKYGERQKYTLDMLKKDFPDMWENIVEAERFAREKYDRTIDELNQMLEFVYPDVVEHAEESIKAIDTRIRRVKEQISHQNDLIVGIRVKIETVNESMRAKSRKDTQAYTDLRNSLSFQNSRLASAKSLMETYEQRMTVLETQKAAIEEAIKNGDILKNRRVLKRNDYFHHYQELAEGYAALARLFRLDDQIDPMIAGKTDQTKPKARWAGFMQQRKRGKYVESAMGGLLKYHQAAAYKLAYDPFISYLRDIENMSREAASLNGTKETNTFNMWLGAFANDIAGKSHKMDRDVSDIGVAPRKAIQMLRWLNGRIKANYVMLNIRSALVQVSNIPNATVYIKNPRDWAKGARCFIEMQGGKGKLGMRDIMSQSNFLSQRYMENFDESSLRSVKKFAGKMMEFGDKVAAELIWWSAYNQYQRNPAAADEMFRSYQSAVDYADDITRRSVGGRGAGELPNILRSEIVNMVAPFQVEVLNTFNNVVEQVGRKNALGLVSFEVSVFVFNALMEIVMGDGMLPFDLISAVIDAIKNAAKDDDDEDKQDPTGYLVQRTLGEIVGGVPFNMLVQFLITDEKLRESLFGEDDPMRYGSGTLGMKALGNLIDVGGNLIGGDGDKLDKFTAMEAVLPFILPMGSKQLVRTWQGIDTVDKGYGSKTDKEGEERIQFAVDKTPLNYIKAGAFGKWTLPEAQEYLDNPSLLSAEDSKIYKQAVAAGVDGDYFFDLRRQMREFEPIKDDDGKTLESKTIQRARLLAEDSTLTSEQKALLIKPLVDDGVAERASIAIAGGASANEFLQFYVDKSAIKEKEGETALAQKATLLLGYKLPDRNVLALLNSMSDMEKLGENAAKAQSGGVGVNEFLQFYVDQSKFKPMVGEDGKKIETTRQRAALILSYGWDDKKTMAILEACGKDAETAYLLAQEAKQYDYTVKEALQYYVDGVSETTVKYGQQIYKEAGVPVSDYIGWYRRKGELVEEHKNGTNQYAAKNAFQDELLQSNLTPEQKAAVERTVYGSPYSCDYTTVYTMRISRYNSANQAATWSQKCEAINQTYGIDKKTLSEAVVAYQSLETKNKANTVAILRALGIPSQYQKTIYKLFDSDWRTLQKWKLGKYSDSSVASDAQIISELGRGTP